MAGLPLEQFQGHLRIFLLFNVGVFTGALFNMVWNPHSALAGMSAGCYALLFAHFAELGMNWKQSRYRWAKLFVLILVVVLDIVSINVTESQDTSVAAEVVSHTAHMGGAFSGLLLGILITRNLVVLPSERIVHIVALVLWLVILAVHVGWFLQWPPRAMFEGTPWCWARQIFNQTLYGDDRYHCVRCADDACIQSWQGQRWMESVDWRICEYQLGWN
ncbi:unnamed protein product [Effrenium voratum]|nr:unnamed protein product [Effrenium voratum]